MNVKTDLEYCVGCFWMFFLYQTWNEAKCTLIAYYLLYENNLFCQMAHGYGLAWLDGFKWDGTILAELPQGLWDMWIFNFYLFFHADFLSSIQEIRLTTCPSFGCWRRMKKDPFCTVRGFISIPCPHFQSRPSKGWWCWWSTQLV